jgi:hypothetical protein
VYTTTLVLRGRRTPPVGSDGSCVASYRLFLAWILVKVFALANAFPLESVELFNLSISGESAKAFELYRWFLPLLRMDTVPNFVQLIKLVQAEAGMGNARVRPPRLELAGTELEKNLKIIREALRTRPQPVSGYTLSGRK